MLRVSKILSRVYSPGHRSLSRSRGKGRVGKKYQSFNGVKPEDECRVPGRVLSRCHTYDGMIRTVEVGRAALGTAFVEFLS